MRFLLAADTDIWRFQPHPEVWMIVLSTIALGFYAVRVVGPKAVAAGTPVASRQNRISFGVGLVVLWIAADWPMHDISEEYLYFVHMIQHLLITFVVPPLLLMSVPEWLGRLIVSEDGSAGKWIRRLSRPVAAGALFNFAVAVSHITVVVNASVESGLFHYLVHLMVFTTAMLMWIPVVSPLPELRSTPPGQMIYLFMMSIIPTIPAAFLTFARNPIYEAYDHPVRLWGISVVQDQQAAGVIMKLIGGFYLWTVIAIIFFTWSSSQEKSSRNMRRVGADGTVTPSLDVSDDGEVLTFEDVQEVFETVPPAPAEQP